MFAWSCEGRSAQELDAEVPVLAIVLQTLGGLCESTGFMITFSTIGIGCVRQVS